MASSRSLWLGVGVAATAALGGYAMYKNGRGARSRGAAGTGGAEPIVIVGAGLVGSLLAIYLRRRGHEVHIYERWPDMRLPSKKGSAGRSINLVLTNRGLGPLDHVGLRDVRKLCVPVAGRMMHGKTEVALQYTPYGLISEHNNSVSRADLNVFLLDAAEQEGATVHFGYRLTDVDAESDPQNTHLTFEVDATTHKVVCPVLMACDGAGSAIRRHLKSLGRIDSNESLLEHGYKELKFPHKQGEGSMRQDALHIWPRGDHMLMTLADMAGTFTGTVYLPNKGEGSFEELCTEAKVVEYFKEHYPDSIELIGGEQELARQFLANPVGKLGTVRCNNWCFGSKVLLLGDSSHAIVPFFGQGCNSGFEDCFVLDRLIEKHGGSLRAAMDEFGVTRRVDSDAIADMAMDNFVEMRDRVGDDRFLLQKKVEHLIEELLPHKYRSRYAMVVYSSIPYSVCQAVGRLQSQILEDLCANITEPGQADMGKAESLIDERITPFLKSHDVSLDF